MPYTIDLDLCLDVPHTRSAETNAAIGYGTAFGLDVKILQLNGPAGGSPLVRFTGDLRGIVQLLLTYSASVGDGELEMYLGMIKRE